jgi:hypothetical protein
MAGRKHVALARVAGVLMLFHGVAHAVYPLRGVGAREMTSMLRALATMPWTIAMIGFVATALALWGVTPLRHHARTIVGVASVASVFAFLQAPTADLLIGVALDIAFVALVTSMATPTVSRVIAPVFGYPILAYVAVSALAHPFTRNWGAGRDDLSPYDVTHAVNIHAPRESVWPWLAQIGQDRGGFYSYDWLENLFGLHIHNATQIDPAWGDRSVGDLVRAAPDGWLGMKDVGWRIETFEPNRELSLKHWGSFILVALPNGDTRLIARSKMADPKYPAQWAAFSFVTLDLPHFIMERKMLLTIKQRAEATKAVVRDPRVANQ